MHTYLWLRLSTWVAQALIVVQEGPRFGNLKWRPSTCFRFFGHAWMGSVCLTNCHCYRCLWLWLTAFGLLGGLHTCMVPTLKFGPNNAHGKWILQKGLPQQFPEWASQGISGLTVQETLMRFPGRILGFRTKKSVPNASEWMKRFSRKTQVRITSLSRVEVSLMMARVFCQYSTSRACPASKGSPVLSTSTSWNASLRGSEARQSKHPKYPPGDKDLLPVAGVPEANLQDGASDPAKTPIE